MECNQVQTNDRDARRKYLDFRAEALKALPGKTPEDFRAEVNRYALAAHGPTPTAEDWLRAAQVVLSSWRVSAPRTDAHLKVRARDVGVGALLKMRHGGEDSVKEIRHMPEGSIRLHFTMGTVLYFNPDQELERAE